MSLYIYVPDEKLRASMRDHLYKKHRSTDSGFDLLCPKMDLNFSINRFGVAIWTGATCAATDLDGFPAPYLLLARSSMSLTPLRMSNQIGLADAGYRGELIARVDCIDYTVPNYPIDHGRRLFQIVQHNWLPWKKIHIVDRLEDLPEAHDDRGTGGFGSTGGS